MTAPYSASNILGGTQQAISSTYKSILMLQATSTRQTRRFKIYDVMVGTNGTPADNYMEYDISATTVAGTATTITANPLDQADQPAATAALANATGEPTVTANSAVFYIGVNQRASYRWVAAPGSEIVAPATSANGYTQRTRSGGYTSTATSTMYFYE